MHSSHPRHTPRELDVRIITGKGSLSTQTRRPDLHRLASDLAAEWCCRQEEYALQAFEVTP